MAYCALHLVIVHTASRVYPDKGLLLSHVRIGATHSDLSDNGQSINRAENAFTETLG